MTVKAHDVTNAKESTCMEVDSTCQSDICYCLDDEMYLIINLSVSRGLQ